MLDEVIAFLNDKNREYAEGDADYNWSVWADNCVHTLRNALAAANIWSPLVGAGRQVSSDIQSRRARKRVREPGRARHRGRYRRLPGNTAQTDPSATRSMNSIGCRHGTARC